MIRVGVDASYERVRADIEVVGLTLEERRFLDVRRRKMKRNSGRKEFGCYSAN